MPLLRGWPLKIGGGWCVQGEMRPFLEAARLAYFWPSRGVARRGQARPVPLEPTADSEGSVGAPSQALTLPFPAVRGGGTGVRAPAPLGSPPGDPDITLRVMTALCLTVSSLPASPPSSCLILVSGV